MLLTIDNKRFFLFRFNHTPLQFALRYNLESADSSHYPKPCTSLNLNKTYRLSMCTRPASLVIVHTLMELISVLRIVAGQHSLFHLSRYSLYPPPIFPPECRSGADFRHFRYAPNWYSSYTLNYYHLTLIYILIVDSFIIVHTQCTDYVSYCYLFHIVQ